MVTRLNKIVTLFRKSRWGNLSEEEHKELDQLLQQKELNHVFQNLGKDEFISKKLREYNRYSAKEAYSKFLALQKKRTVVRWPYYAAAAVIIVMLGITLLLNNQVRMPEVPVLADNKPIAPGNHKAILRLGDGRTINMAEDTLQIQEKAGTCIEYARGQIAYKTTDHVDELIFNELIVPLAGECYITLEDGSRVWVNAGSVLKYPVKFIGAQRKVFLEGEAYFEVVKNSKPFIVSTALGDINVLGTHFDVKAYKEEGKVYTTLVSGKVNFSGSETMEISPGEQVVAFASGKMEKRTVDIAEYIGWKDGMYIFRNQNLETILGDLARWYDITVFYQNPALKKVEFTGNLRRYDNINVFMELLQRTGDLRYQIRGKTIIVYK